MKTRFLAGLTALAFCFISAIAPPAHAQNEPAPEKKALIKELLGLMNAASNSEAIANQISDQLQPLVSRLISNEMRGWIQEQKLAPAEQKRMETLVDETVQRILTRVRADLPKRISFGELIDKVAVEIYDKHFTEVEIKDLIAFYKTSTAQKFIKILPQVTAEMMSGSEKVIGPELTELITESIADELTKLKTKQN
jgi:uncharacterized protein